MEKKSKTLIGIILSLIIIIAILSFYIFRISTSNKSNTEKNTGVGAAGISLEEFNKIDFGMSNFEVSDIIDSNDLWVDDEIYNKVCIEISKEYKNSIYTYTYKYIGDKQRIRYCYLFS